MKDIQEGTRELIVSGGDGAVDFEMSDHALDTVTLAIDALVPTDFGFSIGFGGNAVPDCALLQTVPDGIGVVAFVGKKVVGLDICQSHYVFERRAVRGFTGREVEGERETSGITETMNFTGEPAPRAAKSLLASPPFAPAAET